MRVILRRLLLPLCILLPVLPGCKKESNPEQVALQFFDALYNAHDLEQAEMLVTLSSREKLHADFKYIEGALAMLADKSETTFSFDVLENKTRTLGDSAFVYVWSSVDSSTMETLLIKESQEWRIDFTYDPTLSADKALTEEVLQATRGTVLVPEVAQD